MKKLMVFGISFASCMVVFLMTIFIFKEPITNYLVSNNNLKLVGVLYGKNTLYDVVARNNYISYKKDIDSNVISGSVSSDNVSNDKYEKEILEKDDSTEGYKFINIEINGYKSYLIAIYDPSKVKLVSSRWFNRGNTGQQTVIDICKRYSNQSLRILDLCTGSGAIAISLSKILNTQVFASDVSTKALEVAEKNNVLNNSKVEFIESNLFEQINGEKFDIIVSNPPYIKNEEIKLLSKQVQNEPYIALAGGEDGLDFYRKIIDEAYKHINKNGYLCLEIGYDQKEDVENLLKENKNYSEIKTIQDFSGNDRCTIAKVGKI